MTWDEAKEKLRGRLTECDPAERDRWLDTLTEDNGGHHLGYCLLMDIETRSVDSGLFCRLFDAMSVSSAKRLNDRLHDALCLLDKEEPERLWKSRSKPHRGIQCAKVIEAKDFVNYYYRSRGYLPSRPADVRSAYAQVFWSEKGQSLGTLDEPWSGGRERVWVFPFEDVSELIDEGSPARATNVVEALGLNRVRGAGENGAPLMGMVVYPESFSSDVVQPTCLDVTWQGDCFFVPYPPNEGGWGKTCHTAMGDKEIRERVHRTISANMGEFLARPLGEARGVNINPTAPLRKVRDRLDSLGRG